MARVRAGRHTAALDDVDGEVVVFLIGMRVNRPWKVARWWPVFSAMPRMLRYLEQHPEKGLLAYHQAFLPSPIVVQYWRSFADLERFARDRDDPHLEPWRAFNRRVGDSGDVGIWHETYKVRAGEYEALYGNMPVFGLAAASRHVDIATKGQTAAARIGSPGGEPAVQPY
jgi:fumigallin biosynthesis monooxygenase-like protein